jgi:hypothetical protein
MPLALFFLRRDQTESEIRFFSYLNFLPVALNPLHVLPHLPEWDLIKINIFNLFSSAQIRELMTDPVLR